MKKEVEEKIKGIVKQTLDEAVLSRYIECPECGNLVLRANAEKSGCCGLVYDQKTHKWRTKKVENEESDDWDIDFEEENEEEEDNEEE
jgi:hypothetical protein